MARRASARSPWKAWLLYGLALAAGALLLDWIEYQRLARARTGDAYLLLVATGFLALGLWVGARLVAPREPLPFDGNPAAQASLGISPAELRVLHALADGLSNNEIAERLHVSPHTVKTHVGRLFEKLEAKRRTDAVARARELGILA
jgi:DNA-binding CsgD family transcriptional regulator